MFRVGIILGVAVDLILAVSLLIVVGWVIDSWQDKRVPYVGLIVTGGWLLAFLFAAGSPLLAYGLRRRNANPGHIMVTLWLPALLLISLCVVGLIISPP
jgi:hypothetical protein